MTILKLPHLQTKHGHGYMPFMLSHKNVQVLQTEHTWPYLKFTTSCRLAKQWQQVSCLQHEQFTKMLVLFIQHYPPTIYFNQCLHGAEVEHIRLHLTPLPRLSIIYSYLLTNTFSWNFSTQHPLLGSVQHIFSCIQNKSFSLTPQLIWNRLPKDYSSC